MKKIQQKTLCPSFYNLGKMLILWEIPHFVSE